MTESSSTQLRDDSLRVLYNGSCPICSKEIGHYQRYSEGEGLPIAYDDLMTEAREGWTIDEASAAKALRVRRGDQVLVGVDAFLTLWEALPRYRLLARLVRLPVVFTLARWVYDGVLAPALFTLHSVRRNKLQVIDKK
jgi:predicted DCC family thiol-disulfide oxidoreductase YuxK